MRGFSLQARRVRSFWIVLLPTAVFLMLSYAHANPAIKLKPSQSGSERTSLNRDVGRPAVASSLGKLSKDGSSLDGCSMLDRNLADKRGCGDLGKRRASAPVPEPGSLVLMGCGLLSIAALVRARRAR